jgi:cytochrome P450
MALKEAIDASVVRETSNIPIYDVDMYTDEVLGNPFEHYRNLRDLGPVVFLSAHGVYTMARYAEVRAALGDAKSYSSGSGPALNDICNEIFTGTTLGSDGELHDKLRNVLASRLTPRALRPMNADVEAQARAVVDAVLRKGSFDAVTDLAAPLPLSVVPDYLGWPEESRGNLIRWGSAAFDVVGPANARFEACLPVVAELADHAKSLVENGGLTPGGLADGVLQAAKRGEIEESWPQKLLLDYLNPSVDTTIAAISSAVAQFAANPDQWDLVRANRALIPAALNEVVRLETPITGFARLTTRDIDIDGETIPAGARVLLWYASANRDERKWDDPEKFDVTRSNVVDHVGFGYGEHGCAGQGLARMEFHAMFNALADRVERFHLHESRRALNLTIRSWGSLTVSVDLAS